MPIFSFLLLAVAIILCVVIIAGVAVNQKVINVLLLILYIALVIAQSNWIK